MTLVNIINIRHSFFLSNVINLELFDDKQLFNNVTYAPIPKILLNIFNSKMTLI